jgi:ferric hydroxamate transport system substrate-binding protein
MKKAVGMIFLAVVGLTVLTVSSQAQQTNPCTGKIYKHTLGESCVVGTPKRIVALEWKYAEDLLALGIQPLGVADIKGYNNWVNIAPKFAANVVDVGTRQAPNLELLTTLKPDLILAPSSRVAQMYPRLAQIAPTLTFNAYPQDGSSHLSEMVSTFRTIGAVTGRSSVGEAILSRMNAQFTQARARLVSLKLAGNSFILTQAFTSQNVGTMRLFTRNSMVSEILERMGLKNAWADKPQQFGFTTVGLEGLTQLKPDHFFYIVQDSDNIFAAAGVQALWQSLPFVQKNRAYPMAGNTWTFGGPLSAQTLIGTVMGKLEAKK